MGHWSENLVDEAMRELGGKFDRAVVTDFLAQAGREIDVLSGRTYHPVRRATSVFEPNGLPFVDVPDLLVGSVKPTAEVWPVPDPTNPQVASVLQLESIRDPVPTVLPIASALGIAGQLVAEAEQAGRLSRDYILHWLGANFETEPRTEVFRRVIDPAVRFSIPILGASAGGWWFQISRRLLWQTDETEDEGRLLEPLLDKTLQGDPFSPLVAAEPILIAVPLNRQPVEWAFAARIWPEGVKLYADHSWPRIARAIHGHGIPTVSVDPASTALEVACHVVLKGYWHGYIKSDEPTLADVVARAYPHQVERVRRGTGAPDSASAAVTLLEHLVQPGFDPARGAEVTRRYVHTKARIAVKEHRKRESPDRYPWTQVGISERRYYKLLPQFATKVNGRYEYDVADVVGQMKAHLAKKDPERDKRAAVLELLRSHGFGEAAARKWLQRHQPEEAFGAWPRGARPPDPSDGSELRTAAQR